MHDDFTKLEQLFSQVRKQSADPVMLETLKQIEQICEVSTNCLEELSHLGERLNSRNTDHLLDHVLRTSRKIVNCDGGTVYMLEKEHQGSIITRDARVEEKLTFRVLQNESLSTFMGGLTGTPIHFDPVPLRIDGTPNNSNVSAFCANSKTTVNIKDVYNKEGFNFSGTLRYDMAMGYRSKSMLVYPLENQAGEILGVFQLINRRNRNNQLTHFSKTDEAILLSLAKQAALIIDSRILADQHTKLLDSFVEVLAQGMGEKSPHTYEHIKNVTILGSMIATAIDHNDQGLYKDVRFNSDQMAEIRLAGWLHDLGKTTTPEYIVSKDIKLQSLSDKFETIAERFNSKIKDIQIDYLEKKIAAIEQNLPADQLQTLEQEKDSKIEQLADILEELRACNTGEEQISQENLILIEQARAQSYLSHFSYHFRKGAGGESEVVDMHHFHAEPQHLPLLKKGEVECLQIERGTITLEEREEIKKHAERSWRWLSSLPFPDTMRNLPLYAGAHHELLNGKGYPNGLEADQMPVQARILVIADIFEAISSAARPYRPPNTLSKVLTIMGHMTANGELDAEIMRIFIGSKSYLKYAEAHLLASQIDTIDEEEWLAKFMPAEFQNTLPTCE